MDWISHILLNNLVYKEVPVEPRIWAVIFGIGPDLFGMSPMFRYEYLKKALFFNKMPHQLIPPRVFAIYNAAHSLVFWMVVFCFLFLINQTFWAMLWCGWAIHIVIDIFTHGAKSFPTRIFWPLSDWFFPGFAWSQKKFLLISYGVLILITLVVYL